MPAETDHNFFPALMEKLLPYYIWVSWEVFLLEHVKLPLFFTVVHHKDGDSPHTKLLSAWATAQEGLYMEMPFMREK